MEERMDSLERDFGQLVNEMKHTSEAVGRLADQVARIVDERPKMAVLENDVKMLLRKVAELEAQQFQFRILVEQGRGIHWAITVTIAVVSGIGAAIAATKAGFGRQ